MIAHILRRLANPEPDPPPWSLGIALLTVIIALGALVVGTVITLSLLSQSVYASLLGWSLGSMVTVAYIWSAFRRDRPALRLESTRARLILLLLFAVGVAMLIDLVELGITGASRPVPELRGIIGTGAGAAGWAAAIIFMLIAQPIAEELVFRGIFLPAARHRLGGWGGLLISALAYGLFHMLAYTAAPGDFWYTLVTPTLAGLVLGGVRATTHSTRAAIVAHIGFGVFALLKLLALS